MIHIFARLVRLFPPSFRQRYGEPMLETLAERSREVRLREGRLGLFRFWAANTYDIVRAAILERRDARASNTRRDSTMLGDDALQDLRLGFRRLLKNPGFSSVAFLMLVLGIGANSCIFAVLYGVVLRPLPYPDSDRLVQAWESNPGQGWDFFSFSHPNYLDYRAQNRSFEAFAAYTDASFNLTGDGEPMRIVGGRTTHDLFPALGMRPLLGRGFTPEEDLPGGEARVVLLGRAFWQERFGGDPGVLGKTLQLSGASYEVVGVMPPLGQWLESWQIMIPLNPEPERNRGDHRLGAIGRLAPGVTEPQAEADLDRIAAVLAEQYPVSNRGFDVRLMSLHRSIVSDSTRTALQMLMGAVILVLLIAAANLANLFLARAAGRRHELALSVALGARRSRLIRQLVTESMLLALAGGAAGILLAQGAIELFQRIDPSRIPRLDELRYDGIPLIFTLALTAVTGLFAGLLPAWQASGDHLLDALRGTARGFQGSRRASRVRSILVVSEVAVAVVLLVGAMLLMRSLKEVTSVDPGLRTEQVLAASITVPRGSFGEEGAGALFYQRMLNEIGALPGTKSVGATSGLPFGGGATSMSLGIEGLDLPKGEGPSGYWRLVTPRYFETVEIPLLRGRFFDDRDDWRAEPKAIISRGMAERFWPGENAVGRFFRPWDRDPVEIVGVVGDVRERDLETTEVNMVYLPFYAFYGWSDMFLVVRSEGEPLAALAALRAVVSRMAPDVPLSNARPLGETMERTLASRQFNTVLLASFALVALALAAIGIYGVMAFTVTQRQSEIGIRMSIGARPGQVVRMVLRESMRVVALGAAIGTLAALGLARLLNSLLYGIQSTDPASIALAVVFLGLVALLATAVPARRASRVDAISALRGE